tara:strand:+ start:620 stop:1462 length:843 start_codon:yes stop_codon:yes gene_type:complete
MSGGGTTTQIQELNPTQEPFVEYGLQEAQRLYESGSPVYFPGQTYVGPSEQTQTALDAAQNRAIQGNPLVPAAQSQFQSTIEGDYLSATNPYFANRFNTAADAAQQRYFDAMNQINSQASMAGRYGSNAMGQLQDRATSQFAKSLTDTAGELAFNNYAQERARQLAAAQSAPALAAQDYADIDRMLSLGNISEGYQQQALQDSISRFDFEQGMPQNKLQNFLSAAYGAPLGGQTTVPVQRGGIQGLLGGALAGGALASSIPALGPYALPIAAGAGLLGAL